MPTYEYCCNTCGYDFDAQQRFEDEPLTVCPKCGSPLRKVFNSVGIVFKGSGFYSTDNHSATKPPATESHSSDAAAKDKAPETKVETPVKDAPSSKTEPAAAA